MLPYKTLIQLDPDSRVPRYLQICHELIGHISDGTIAPGQRLPGSRQLGMLLSLNRRTVIAAYDELAAQGWVIVRPSKGYFVSEQLPGIKPRKDRPQPGHQEMVRTAFDLVSPSAVPAVRPRAVAINDGYPDVRLAPLKELSKNYAYILRSPMANQLMSYRQNYLGDEPLRQELARYLAETRSIHVPVDNIMTTRGSLMAFFILFTTLFQSGSKEVIVGYPGFNECYETIRLAGGQLHFVPVDHDGMQTEAIAVLCRKRSIRAVFIIPHHHYPTTVSLSATRRMELLALAEQYGFAIIEDDYDYDFHYASAPILPIASMDNAGSVAYVGSFSKTVAPSLRLGFIVAPRQLIEAAAQVSKHIDSYGNSAMERSVAMLFQEGLIRRHMRKALKTYRERRDYFCQQLQVQMADYLDFQKPEGGLALWAQLKQHSLARLVAQGQRVGINIPDGLGYYAQAYEADALRIGFASMTQQEADELIGYMRRALQAD